MYVYEPPTKNETTTIILSINYPAGRKCQQSSARLVPAYNNDINSIRLGFFFYLFFYRGVLRARLIALCAPGPRCSPTAGTAARRRARRLTRGIGARVSASPANRTFADTPIGHSHFTSSRLRPRPMRTERAGTAETIAK